MVWFFSDTFIWRAEGGLSLDGAKRGSAGQTSVSEEKGVCFFGSLSAPAPGRK